MKKALIAVALLAEFVFVAGPGYSFDRPVINTNFLVNVDDFLPWNSGGSAKALGMGGAFTAVADDLGAVEYNPAGLAKIDRFNVSALGVFSRHSEIDSQGNNSTKWDSKLTYGGAAIKIGPAAIGVSAKQPFFPGAFQQFSGLQYNVHAPDNWPMRYDTLSDQLATDGLKTYVLTVGLDLGRLSVGVNGNYIKGDVVRTVRGVNSSALGSNINSEFNSIDQASFKGYTMDAGLLLNLGILRLGAAAKNIVGKVDVTEKYLWKDDFAVGQWWTYDPPAATDTLTTFAPTYSAGAALVFGKILTLDMDYATVNLKSSDKSMGRLGAELWVIPGFLAARGGLKTDFKNLTQFGDQKNMEYFLGAGLELWALTVDASASLAQVKEGTQGNSFTGAASASLKF